MPVPGTGTQGREPLGSPGVVHAASVECWQAPPSPEPALVTLPEVWTRDVCPSTCQEVSCTPSRLFRMVVMIHTLPLCPARTCHHPHPCSLFVLLLQKAIFLSKYPLLCPSAISLVLALSSAVCKSSQCTFVCYHYLCPQTQGSLVV